MGFLIFVNELTYEFLLGIVEQFQRAVHLVQKQQQQQHSQHDLAESNSQGHIHQHHSCHTSPVPSVAVPKPKGLMISPQQPTATFSAPLLQQGGSIHRQDQQPQHGVSMTLFSGNGGSSLSGNVGDVSNYHGELGELRENCSDGKLSTFYSSGACFVIVGMSSERKC